MFLVIGYGNELRADDGLGPALARAIEQRGLPDLEVIVSHQLTPELAEPISQAQAVLFIDATVNGPARPQIRPIIPLDAPCLRTHFAHPAALLALAQELFGRAPRGWWITLPAFDLSFGEGLSPGAERMLGAGMRAFNRLLSRAPWTNAGADRAPLRRSL